MRYVVALAVVGVLVVAISLCANQTSTSLQTRFRQRLIESQKAGHIPANIDLNSADLTDFGTEVSELEMLQVQTLGLWIALRVLLIPAAIATALLVAHFWPSTSRHDRDNAATSTSQNK